MLPAGGRDHNKKTVASNPTLLLYASGRLYDGRTANRPWIQEAPDSLTQTVWDTPVEISPALARRLALTSGDRVEITGAGGQVMATVRVLPGTRDDVAAMPLGGGRQRAGSVASGRGARAWSLIKPVLDPLGGGLAAAQTTVSLRKASAGRLLTVEGDPATHGRPIVPVVTMSDALRGRFPKQTLHGTVVVDVATGRIVEGAEGRMAAKLDKIGKRKTGQRPPGSFYPAHDTPGHLWGMTVDLDLCTGCGACVVACQAENNVATVGPDQIPLGREMHWIRIERYWTAARDGRDPLPRFLPVMCQHCENAPCEPVCPVFASYHTGDGLNAQIYNRCIGTRYCANNCPYKVRRFNWFDYEWPEPLNEQLNPDVTVRSKGVMEKCTFCVQRIREKVNRARAEGREVAPGEVVPACVQTCPTGALGFGDRNREGSAVSRLAADPRAYRLLDYYLNNGPAVSYLCKVTREEAS
jgi:molybdopterin-containing oxidoreductase family iron-sulfur binding subunit